jgi:chromosome segregation ATPase
MMDFLQRRLESLENDLTRERERAQSAQNLIAHQDALRTEVESSLKSVHEQLRREKAERESEEEKFHARGRIESLEKSLDEMHQAWTALVKDAIVRREGDKTPAELADLKSKIESWREALPKMEACLETIARDLPQSSQRLLADAGERLTGLCKQVTDTLAAWERRHALETQRQESVLADLGRERAALQKQWEEANHATRRDRVR